MKETRSEKIVV